MSAVVWAAIITGSCAVTAAVGSVLLGRFLDGRNKVLVKGNGTALTSGKWTGKVHQDHGPGGAPITYEAEVHFEEHGKAIKGIVTLKATIQGVEISNTVELDGGFYIHNFLKFNYVSTDKNLIQFGSIVLELHADGRHIDGCFVGYGHLSRSVINGRASLHRD